MRCFSFWRVRVAPRPSGAACASRSGFRGGGEAVDLRGPDPAQCGAHREVVAWYGQWKNNYICMLTACKFLRLETVISKSH